MDRRGFTGGHADGRVRARGLTRAAAAAGTTAAMSSSLDRARTPTLNLNRGPSPSAHRRLPSVLRTPSISSLTVGVPLTPRHFSPGGSLHSSEEPLILEIGSKILRVGFASEGAPRCSIPWNGELCRVAGDVVNHGDGSTLRRIELWRPDLAGLDMGLVADLVERGVRKAYNKCVRLRGLWGTRDGRADGGCRYLLIDSKTRKVVMPVPPLLPTHLLTNAVMTVFTHFQPPSITLMSSPVLATIAAGLRSALVMDIGWHETIVTPVYELRPIEGRGVGVHGRCRRGIKVLKEQWVEMIQSGLEEAGKDTNVDPDEVEEAMERVGWCRSFADPSQPAPAQELPPSEQFEIPFSTTTPPCVLKIPFDLLSIPAERTFFAPTTTPSVTPDIPDDDDNSLPQLLYTTLLHSAVDVRAACLSRIVIVGGGSRILGLQKRVVDELRSLVEARGWSRSSRRPKARSTSTASTPDDVAREREGAAEAPKVKGVRSLGVWAGGSLLASMKVRGKLELDREKFLSAVTGGGTGLPASVL